MSITKAQAKSLLQLLQEIPDLRKALENCPDYFENVNCKCNENCNGCWSKYLEKFIQK
jgi:hypothetical protein